MQTITITIDPTTGQLELQTSEGVTRAQVRAALSSALALLDADTIAEAILAKGMAAATHRKVLSPQEIDGLFSERMGKA